MSAEMTPVADYMHITGTLEDLLSRFRVKIPRALCGVMQVGYLTGVTMCPSCVDIAGWTAAEVSSAEEFLRAEAGW
jgi:hypothetical protein